MSSSLRPSERINHRVRLNGLTGAAIRPPPPMGGRGWALYLWQGQTLCLWLGCLKRLAALLLHKKLWTQRLIAACPRKFHLREATTRQTARIRKACAAVLFWHQKSTQKSAAVSHAADPRASQGAPAGTSVYPIHVRHSVLANAKSKAFALTASRALPFARRPPWAGESRRFARRL